MKWIVVLIFCALIQVFDTWKVSLNISIDQFASSTKPAPTLADERSDELFKKYRDRLNKHRTNGKYINEAHFQRARANFARNLARIEAHNARRKAGLESYSVASYDQFADRNRTNVISEICRTQVPHSVRALKEPINNASLYPKGRVQVDWKGALSPVKDQGECGACWAFATVAQVEARVRINNQKLKTNILSPQNLINCNRGINNGCYGGWPTIALEYLVANKTATDAAVPFVGVQKACRAGTINATITSAIEYEPNGNVQLMKNIISVEGPIIAAVYVTPNFLNYKSGIFQDKTCQKLAPNCGVNHAVVITGYRKNATTGQEYFILLNSWGKYWGEGGFMRIAPTACSVACKAMFGR